MSSMRSDPQTRRVSAGDFNAAKVFSATMFQDRERLGERVTDWIRQNPSHVITEITVTQSSDSSFHCIAFSVFYRETPQAR